MSKKVLRRVLLKNYDKRVEKSLLYGTISKKQYNNEIVDKLENDEVLVKVKACAVNKFDQQVREGEYKDLFCSKNNIIGYSISGIVNKIGCNVNKSLFQIGDHIAGFLPLNCKFGGYSDFCITKAHNLFAIPNNFGSLKHESVAASILPGIRAFNALHYKAQLQKNQFIYIHKGALGISHISVQYASSIVQAKVITSISSDEELNYIQDLPTNNIVKIIDLRKDDVYDSIMEQTGGIGVSCVLDSDGSLTLPYSLPFLSFNSTFLSPTIDIIWDNATKRQLLIKNMKIGFLFEHSFSLSNLEKGKLLHMISETLNLISKKKIQVQINKIYPLEKIREAHRNKFPIFGQVVIQI